MIKKLFLSLLVLTCSIPLLAGEPKAVLSTANTTFSVKDPIWIDTVGSTGKAFTWSVTPESEKANCKFMSTNTIDKDGKVVNEFIAFYYGTKPVTVHFIFVAVEDNKSDIAILKIVYGGGDIPPVPPVVPTPDLPLPPPDIVQLVKPLILLVTDKNDAQELVGFYKAMAKFIKGSDKPLTVTTFNNIYTEAGKSIFKDSGFKQKYPGLGEAIDKVLATKLGLEVVPLTNTKKQDVVDILNGIAWAFSQVGK